MPWTAIAPRVCLLLNNVFIFAHWLNSWDQCGRPIIGSWPVTKHAFTLAFLVGLFGGSAVLIAIDAMPSHTSSAVHTFLLEASWLFGIGNLTCWEWMFAKGHLGICRIIFPVATLSFVMLQVIGLILASVTDDAKATILHSHGVCGTLIVAAVPITNTPLLMVPTRNTFWLFVFLAVLFNLALIGHYFFVWRVGVTEDFLLASSITICCLGIVMFFVQLYVAIQKHRARDETPTSSTAERVTWSCLPLKYLERICPAIFATPRWDWATFASLPGFGSSAKGHDVQ